MSASTFPSLGQLLQNFFLERLQAQQQASPHTLASYRDTIRLLIGFVHKQNGRSATQQTLADWNAKTILRFLDHLEKERHCKVRTRNNRLAALRAFMRYAAQQAPESIALAHQVLAIPVKRFERPLVHSLTRPQVEAILSATQAAPSARRDHLLFNFLLQTGARLGEALQLCQQDIRWGPPATVCLHGKGRKNRTLPLLKSLTQELKAFLKTHPDELIFQNRFGQRLSRWGAEKRLHRTVERAAHACPSLKGLKISPHTFRHTHALELLQAGVDIAVIALLLGHESTTTTHHYMELDLPMKERCLRKLQTPKSNPKRFAPTDAMLEFLNQL